MGLNEFFELPVGCKFSADQARRLNEALSKVRLEDIPPEKRPLVADYLHNAILWRTVEPSIYDDLSALLRDLQEAR